ncbi:MAG TPA: amidohydrolase family protein [Oscillatoriaceae cyanobacterium]
MPRGAAHGRFIDFHAHLRGKSEIAPPEMPRFPLLHRAAEWFEPLVYEGVGLFARFGRHRALTTIYPHFTGVGFNELVRQFHKYQAAELVRSMDDAGIARSVVLAIEPFLKTLEILDAIAPFRERFAVFCSVDPEDPDFAAHFEAYWRTGMVRGLKIHPALAGPVPTSARMFELVALAERYDMPVIIHTGTFPFPLVEGTNNALSLEPVIKAFPRVPIVLAHIGWDQHEHVLALGRDYENVYTDTSWQPPHIIRRAIATLGVARVMFGSDFPLFRQSTALETLRAALHADELAPVGYENAERLLARARLPDAPSAA